jgi:hypothetical protein
MMPERCAKGLRILVFTALIILGAFDGVAGAMTWTFAFLGMMTMMTQWRLAREGSPHQRAQVVVISCKS